jgi:phosphoribosylglycinamide formyltransferase-1
VHQAVRASGERQTGATVHFVDEGIDSGLILLQQAIAIDPTWTAEEIQSEVLKIEHKLLPKAVRAICADKVEIIDNKVRLWE